LSGAEVQTCVSIQVSLNGVHGKVDSATVAMMRFALKATQLERAGWIEVPAML